MYMKTNIILGSIIGLPIIAVIAVVAMLIKLNNDITNAFGKVDKLQKDLGVATTTQGQIVQFLNQAIEAQQKAQQQTQAPQATPEIKK